MSLKPELTEKQNIRKPLQSFWRDTSSLLAAARQIAAVSVNMGNWHFLWVMRPERSELDGGRSILAQYLLCIMGFSRTVWHFQ